MELLRTMEDLDPELMLHRYDDGPFGTCIKHPLVFSIAHHPAQNAFCNRQLKQKQEALQEAEREERWHTYVYLHERPYRIDAFMAIQHMLDDRQYWELLGDVWIDSENIWQNLELWRELLTAPRGSREFIMSEEDRKVFTLPPEQGGFPPRQRVYRGFNNEDGLDGYSWTLDKPRAKWFALRRAYEDDVAYVATAWVTPDKAIAYHTGRGEAEIVVLPEDVLDVFVEEVERNTGCVDA
jgi:hypothetical protein